MLFWVDEAVGFLVGFPGAFVGFVLFAIGLSEVDLGKVAVVFEGGCIMDGGFGALGSVK